MFSLYVCDIPQNITKEELEKVFSQFNGFHEVRLAKDKNRQRIAFVDYDTPQAAEYAMSSTIGYRLSNSNKGITVRFSENSKNSQAQPHNGMPTKRRETSQNSARGHQPFQSASQAVGGSGSGSGLNTLNGVNDGGGAPSGSQKHRAGGFCGPGGQGGPPRLNQGGGQGGPQQRQLVGASGQSHTMYQSDPAQQMQQRYYPPQANLSGAPIVDLPHPQNQPFLDHQFGAAAAAAAAAAGNQFVSNHLNQQIGGPQQGPNGPNGGPPPNPLFGSGGPGQAAPHLMNAGPGAGGGFPQIAAPGGKPNNNGGQQQQQQQANNPILNSNNNNNNNKSPNNGGFGGENGGGVGLRNPEQSVFPQQPPPTVQHHLTPFDAAGAQQPNQQFAMAIGAAGSDLASGHGGGKPGESFMGVGHHQMLPVLPPRDAGAPQPQKVQQAQNTQQNLKLPQQQNQQQQQQQQNQDPTSQLSAAAAAAAGGGGNSHQDIYNLLSNLNSMASSMASSIVNQQNVVQQQHQQQPPQPHPQNKTDNGGGGALQNNQFQQPNNTTGDVSQQQQQQQQFLTTNDLYDIQKSRNNEQPQLCVQQPPTGANSANQQSSTTDQIQNQLIQSLISTLQQGAQPAPGTPSQQLDQLNNWQAPAQPQEQQQIGAGFPQQQAPFEALPQSQSQRGNGPARVVPIQNNQNHGAQTNNSNNANGNGQHQQTSQQQQQQQQQQAQGSNNNQQQNCGNVANVNSIINHHPSNININNNQQQQSHNTNSGNHGSNIMAGSGTNIQNTTAGAPSSTNNSNNNNNQQAASINNNQNKQQSLQKTVVQHIQAMFGQDIFCVPKHATNTIYVEGIPIDATEREVSHIFRPFKGFKSVRLIPREINPDEKVILCFADFENDFQTTLVINTLQGYRFDKDDIWGLQFSYANKQTNVLHQQQHGAKGGENAKETASAANPNNNNNNSIVNRTMNSGSGAGNSAAEASSTSKDGAQHGGGKPASSNDAAQHSAHSNNNNNTSSKKQ